MTYEAKNGSSNYGAFAFIGEEEGNGLLCGQNAVNLKALWQIGYGTQSTSITSQKTTNTYYPCEIKYDNGVWTATLNGAVITRNEVYTHREYVGFRAEAQGYIKNVIVMPL